MKFKKKIVVAFLVLSLLVPTVKVLADSYTSYMEISANSTLTGKTRKYENANHRITIKNAQINYGYDESGLVIAIYNDGFLSNKQLSRKVTSFVNGQSRTVEMGSVGSGKRYYRFGTYQNALMDGNSGHGVHYPGLKSDTVISESYK